MRLLTYALLASCTTCAFANSLDLAFQQTLIKHITRADSVTEHTFTQWIDHKRPELGTFSQRYFLDESYVQKNNAPTFFYICGEQACNPLALEGIRPLAQKYHARLVALEHRYYGISQPRPSLSFEDLQFLTYDNALRDLVTFEVDAIRNQHWTGKWIGN